MSAQELPLQHSDIHTPYPASFHPDSDVDIPAAFNLSMSSHAMPELSAAAPPSSTAGSPGGLQAETPASFISPKVEHIDGQDAEFLESILAAPRADEPMTMSSARHDDKADEPYAKLIYKALMGQPDYTMTLQELYQWFRENTSKAKNERGGWQNSIRHNLSMNAVSEYWTPKPSMHVCFRFLPEWTFLSFFSFRPTPLPTAPASGANICMFFSFSFSLPSCLLRCMRLPSSICPVSIIAAF